MREEWGFYELAEGGVGGGADGLYDGVGVAEGGCRQG